MSPSPDFGVWVAALLTLCVFSFLWKDNPLYKFAEHLFVGVSAGYYLVLNFWNVIHANLWTPLTRAFGDAPGGAWHAGLGDYRGWLLIPAGLGLLLFTRLVPRIGWVARFTLAVILGVFAGLKTTGYLQGDFVQQIGASLVPLWTGHPWADFNAILFTIGLVTSLLYFYFSREHRGPLGAASRAGLWFLMVSFGAAYGYTVMSRVSLLIGRFQFLLQDWLGLH